MPTHPTCNIYALGCFHGGNRLGQGGGPVRCCATGLQLKHQQSNCAKSSLSWNWTKNVELWRASKRKKAFRRQQLLQKWQINDTGCLELEINCQKFLSLWCALGRLLRPLEPLWSRTFLKKSLPVFQRCSCHVSVWTTGSRTKLSQSLLWLMCDLCIWLCVADIFW